jgi:hypothetical protein
MDQSCVIRVSYVNCRHANVFANLFSLMLDANIPDIASERDKTVKKVSQSTNVVNKYQSFVVIFLFFQLLDKFRLDLDDEKAISYLKDLIDSSIGALVPQLYDYIHNLTSAFR